jgi:Fe-S cluster assembly scaffold protein SufB
VSTHIVVLAGAGSSVTIVEELGGEAGWNHAVEIVAEDGARVDYASLNFSQKQAKVLIWQRSAIGANASVTWRNATIGGKSVEHDLRSHVIGEHGVSQIDWLFYARGDERQTLGVRNIFDGNTGGGKISMKGVAEERAHTACRAMIDIGLGGGGTDTYLTQEVLMLDKTSKVDAVPGLEIKTNDVKASHSATVSRVTEEDLFYFASRGIDQAEARRMFILGFIGDLAERVGDASAREHILAQVEEKYSRSR